MPLWRQTFLACSVSAVQDNSEMLPPLATVLPAAASRCPIRSVISARTSRSTAVRRPPYTSCCHRGRGKKPNPGPTAPSLFPLPESSITPWLLRCLRALAVATLAVAFSAPSLLQAAPASSVGERSSLDATSYDCEDVGRYYAGLDGLTGDELRTELAAVVSPHAALRYKDVSFLVAWLSISFRVSLLIWCEFWLES